MKITGPIKNKTVAVWLTLLTGPAGLHRLYLFGRFDGLSALQLVPTLIGAYGVLRAREIGLDDHASWVLIPWIGFSVAASSLTAIVYGLTEAKKWNQRFNAQQPQSTAGNTGWLTIGGVVAALLLGATVLLSSIAFSFQRYFEYQAEEPPAVAMAAEPKKAAG